MKNKLYYLLGLLLLTSFIAKSQTTNNPKFSDLKIRNIINKMTLDEKIAMLHAKSQFSSAGVPRLGIPDLQSDDGPLGVREEVNIDWSPKGLKNDSATFFPNGSALAATWNPELALRYGQALGEESKARGKDIILAPAFNIARTPLCGRTYEYLSEDPLLNSLLAVEAVRGIQQWDVAACVKHFALNNQEKQRKLVNVEADERTLREIYLPAFKAAVQKGKAWTLMSAYNKFRGVYCAENAYLLNEILKKEWGFKGVVVSDWGGTHSTLASAVNGLDVEMGTEKPYEDFYFAKPLKEAIVSGQLDIKVIDEKVYRLLSVIYQTSLSGRKLSPLLGSASHLKTAYDIAAESIVLLKNSRNTLPINSANLKNVLVIGDNATRMFQRGGFGAGVKAKSEITLLDGLKQRLGQQVKIDFEQGYKGEYASEWSEEKKNIANQPDSRLISLAAIKARDADLVILCVGGNRDYETEGEDRKNLDLPFGQQALIDAVLAANPAAIVVFTGGAPYNISKLSDQSSSLIWSWYNGSANGLALADVITGKINPSGKLPFTFPNRLEDSPTEMLHTYPGNNGQTEYKEGILVGYRWYDTKKIKPLYSFGYGLSYSRFVFSDMSTDKKQYKNGENVTVTFKLSNKSSRVGKEVIQLYIGKQVSTVTRALKELKAFKKVSVEPGKAAAVKLTIKTNELAYYSTKLKKWLVEPGKYFLSIGNSSTAISETVSINIY
ncbi:MAG: glycosyl hydrolase [Pedobacter sp.]|nr:MAG: glycosyl hydrolase [Pedobacter sp.]